jgi:hypothetical protein
MSFSILPPNSPILNKSGHVAPEWYRFFAAIQRVAGSGLVESIQQGNYITWGATTILPNDKVLAAGTAIDIALTDDNVTIALEDTAVSPGIYGADTQTVSFTVDQQGRLTGAEAFDLNTSNITEGTNLFFTEDRARDSVSGADGVSYNSGTGVFSADETWLNDRYVQIEVGPNWTAATGTASRATFATYTAPVISNPPTQAEVQAIADAVQVLSQRAKAIIDDLIGNSAFPS